MNTILLHKEKSAYFAKKSSRAMNKMMFIRKKLHHWKKIDLESLSTENEGKKWIDLAPSRVCLIHKVKNAKMVNIGETVFYLKSQI